MLRHKNDFITWDSWMWMGNGIVSHGEKRGLMRFPDVKSRENRKGEALHAHHLEYAWSAVFSVQDSDVGSRAGIMTCLSKETKHLQLAIVLSPSMFRIQA